MYICNLKKIGINEIHRLNMDPENGTLAALKYKIVEELGGELDAEKLKKLNAFVRNCGTCAEFQRLVEDVIPTNADKKAVENREG